MKYNLFGPVLIFVYSAIFSLVSGCGPDKTTSQNHFGNYEYSNQQSFLQTFPRNNGNDSPAICPAMLRPIPENFKRSCEIRGGVVKRRGPCGASFYCTADDGAAMQIEPYVFVNFSGHKQICKSNTQLTCPAFPLVASDEFRTKCELWNGNIVRCGDCGSTILCMKKEFTK